MARPTLCTQALAGMTSSRGQVLGAELQPGRDGSALRLRSAGKKSPGGQPARRYEEVGLCARLSAFAEPWPRWACRPLRARAGAGAGAAAPAAPVRGQVQWSSGWGPKPPPQTLGPTTSSSSSTARRGKEAKIDFRGARAPPTPTLARAQRPCPHVGPIPRACDTLRPRCTLVAPSPPLPCPCHVAPHLPSTPPALRARSLGPRARWRRMWQLPRR